MGHDQCNKTSSIEKYLKTRISDTLDKFGYINTYSPKQSAAELVDTTINNDIDFALSIKRNYYFEYKDANRLIPQTCIVSVYGKENINVFSESVESIFCSLEFQQNIELRVNSTEILAQYLRIANIDVDKTVEIGKAISGLTDYNQVEEALYDLDLNFKQNHKLCKCLKCTNIQQVIDICCEQGLNENLRYYIGVFEVLDLNINYIKGSNNARLIYDALMEQDEYGLNYGVFLPESNVRIGKGHEKLYKEKKLAYNQYTHDLKALTAGMMNEDHTLFAPRKRIYLNSQDIERYSTKVANELRNSGYEVFNDFYTELDEKKIIENAVLNNCSHYTVLDEQSMTNMFLVIKTIESDETEEFILRAE